MEVKYNAKFVHIIVKNALLFQLIAYPAQDKIEQFLLQVLLKLAIVQPAFKIMVN